jgi:hypothetical protein
MSLLAVVLAASASWILPAELARFGVQHLPSNPQAAAKAATGAARAAWAARFAAFRGDLWTEYAFTYAILLWGRQQTDATTAIQPRIVIERALASAPHRSGIWLLAVGLGSKLNWPNWNPVSSLRMSYYTGSNELYLTPLRLLIAIQSVALTDSELEGFVRRDVEMILTRFPELRPALATAYNVAEPDAKRFLESVVAEIEPAFLQEMHTNPRP